jgi:hypothetical protein
MKSLPLVRRAYIGSEAESEILQFEASVSFSSGPEDLTRQIRREGEADCEG